MSEFGNPFNPFNEVDLELAHGRACYTLPGCLGRLQIQYMDYHSEDVDTDQASIPGKTIRILEMACHGPFSSDLNAFLNPYAEVYRKQEMIGWPLNMDAVISMGDIVGDAGVIRRWATLRRTDALPFGVCGVSRMQEGRLEEWNALTIDYGLIDDEVDVEFWGEVNDSEKPHSARIDEVDGRVFEAHIESIYRAMLRRLNSETRAETA